MCEIQVRQNLDEQVASGMLAKGLKEGSQVVTVRTECLVWVVAYGLDSHDVVHVQRIRGLDPFLSSTKSAHLECSFSIAVDTLHTLYWSRAFPVKFKSSNGESQEDKIYKIRCTNNATRSLFF